MMRCSAKDVLELIKVRQTVFLVMAMYIGMLSAVESYSQLLGVGLVAGVTAFMAIAATTSINMVFDADIDALMIRTKERPIPRGICNPCITLYASIVVLAASIIISVMLVGFLFALFIAVGAFADIILYTLYSKRRMPLNVFLGSIAGAAPVLGGYAAVKHTLDVTALLLASIIVAWIPSHIWTLSLHYRDDYRRAHIPMLPVVKGEHTARLSVAISLAIFFTLISILMVLGVIPILVSLPVLMVGAATLLSLRNCHSGSCLTSFKLVNIMLGLFLALYVAYKLVIITPRVIPFS